MYSELMNLLWVNFKKMKALIAPCKCVLCQEVHHTYGLFTAVVMNIITSVGIRRSLNCNFDLE